jgi:hypothetical protein
MAEASVLDPEIDVGLENTEPERKPYDGKRDGKRGLSKRFQRESPPEERQSFFEHTSGLSEVEWERHLLYVYQWAPIVDLTKGGTERKYRKIYTRHMSEEDIKRDVGSGTYELKLNKIDADSRKEKTDRKLVVSILDYDFPPNLPPGQWLDDPRNSDWQWAKPLLQKKYQVADTTRGNGAPTWTEMMQFMEHQARSTNTPKEQLMSSIVAILPALLQQQNNAQDPSKIIDSMIKVKDMVTPPPAPKQESLIDAVIALKGILAPAPPPPRDDTMLTFLMKQLELQQQATNKIQEILLTQKTEQANPLGQIDMITSVFTRMSDLIGKGTPKEPWQEIVSELGPKVVELGQNFLTQKAIIDRMKLQNPTLQNQNIQNRTIQQTVQPPPSPPSTGTPAQETTAVNPEVIQPEMDVNERTMLVQIAVFASQALNLGLYGDQFAEQICKKFGDLAYDEFISHFDKTKLIEKIKSIPEAWQLLQEHEPKLEKFVDDFYGFAEEDEPDPPPPVENAAPKPKGKGKKK